MAILARSESRQGKTVRLLAVHSTEGNDVLRVNDAVALRDAAWWTGSSHAICDNEALLTPAEGCVPYNLAAWTLRSGNLISDNIEQVGWARWTRDEWLAHPGTLDGTARWLADRSKARGIPLVKLSPADVAAGRSGVIGHVDWTVGMKDGTHTDPGPNYPWDVVLAKATAYADGIPQEDDEMDAQTRNEIAATNENVNQIRVYLGILKTAIDQVGAHVGAPADVDEAAVVKLLAPALIAAMGEAKGLTEADVEAAVRKVFADAAAA